VFWNVLVQVKWQGFGSTGGGGNSNLTYYILGGVIGAVILVAVIARVAAKGGGQKGEKFRKGAFKKECRKMGLADTHISFLLDLIKQNDIQNGYKLLENGRQLDMLLRQSLAELEAIDIPEERKEARRLMIYHIKQIIERNSRVKRGDTNTRTLRVGQEVVLDIENGRFESKVSANLKDAVLVYAPSNAAGRMVNIPRWTKLNVQFWRNEGDMYSFSTKVMGTKTIKGIPVLLLQHSKHVRALQRRRYRRKEVGRPAYFTSVSIVATGTGKNRTRQAVVNSKRNALGTLLEVSTGGCSIKTNFPLKRGELIRVQFETERRNPVIAFGKVKSTEKTRPVGSVMHIQFTRLSRKNINKINSYVYDDISRILE
jgi:c-di-GMP-binding flagellar brake protein YcgR